MITIDVKYSSSNGNLMIVKNENTKILLECGVEKDKLIKTLNQDNLMITDFKACFISHVHNDHARLADYVSFFIPTYSTSEVKNKFTKVYIHVLANKEPVKIGSIVVYPINVFHGSCENNAFVFVDKNSKVLFATDFSIMKANLSNLDFDEIYIECNYDDDMLKEALNDHADNRHLKYIRQLSTHMSLKNCIEHLKILDLHKCKKIVLLHASRFLIDKDKACEKIRKIFKIDTYFGEYEDEKL